MWSGQSWCGCRKANLFDFVSGRTSCSCGMILMSLCAELESGVRLGVAEPLQPSPIWPIQQQVTTTSDSLSVHYGEWAGAQEHPEIVEQLLQEELAEGWICEVHGGVDELKRRYDLWSRLVSSMSSWHLVAAPALLLILLFQELRTRL